MLESNTIDARYLTSLVILVESIFDEQSIKNNPTVSKEMKEIQVLVVNQINKNFNQASLIDLAYAFKSASKGKDKLFMHKF